MSAPCPFCEFETSDFRKNHNWNCTRCGKDYADWLLTLKSKRNSNKDVETKATDEKLKLFSQKEIPLEAEPVKSARLLFVFAALGLLALSFAVDGIFTWFYLISIPLAGYYALTIYRTGYALGQHDVVYQRNKNPFMYRVHLWSLIVYMFVALYLCLD